MSSDADSDAAATVALYDSLYTQAICAMATAVLFIYDSSITFDREVASIWTAKRTGTSLLFFANKWISMVVYVMVLVADTFTVSDERCSSIQLATTAFTVLQFVPWAVFSALRAFVLSRSKPLGLLVFALSLAPVGANLVEYGYQLSGEMFPPFGCLGLDNITTEIGISECAGSFIVPVVVISRAPLIVVDVILIYVTWTKLRIGGVLGHIRQSRSPSLSDVLFRGGTIYFIILFTLNVLHLAFSLTALAGIPGSGASILTLFTAPITAIIVSRFFLELQEANRMVVRLDSYNTSGNYPYDSTPTFISSLGGFVHSAWSDKEELEMHVHWPAQVSGEEESAGLPETPQKTAFVSSPT